MPWGRRVVRAVDFDDCLLLVRVFETMATLGAAVDVQVRVPLFPHLLFPHVLGVSPSSHSLSASLSHSH